MDSDIGGILENLWRKMPQTRRIAAQTVCHFSHNADFCRLRISKYPANAHKTNYFSVLVVGCWLADFL